MRNENDPHQNLSEKGARLCRRPAEHGAASRRRWKFGCCCGGSRTTQPRSGFFMPSLNILAALLIACSMCAATVTWTNATGGDWSNTNNWSTGALPGAGDDVIIPPGSPITVTHSTGTDTIHSLQNNQAFTLSGGSLAIATTLLASNTVTLAGGTLTTATVVTTNGASLVVSSGKFDGVTVNGTLDVGNSVNGAALTVTNGLALNGTALVGNPTNSWTGVISFAGSQTLGGSGTVVFGNAFYGYNALLVANGGTTLTIGSGITIEGQNGSIGYSPWEGGAQNGSVVNQGTIQADVSGGTIAINAQPFNNQATLVVYNGGTLAVAGTGTNSGSVTGAGGAFSASGLWANHSGTIMPEGTN